MRCRFGHWQSPTHPEDILQTEEAVRKAGTYHPDGKIEGMVTCLDGPIILYTIEGEAHELIPDTNVLRYYEYDDEWYPRNAIP